MGPARNRRRLNWPVPIAPRGALLKLPGSFIFEQNIRGSNQLPQQIMKKDLLLTPSTQHPKENTYMKWKQFLTPVKSINTNEAKAFMDKNDVDDFTILDVRQPSEYEEGHIPGATLIPLPDLGDRLHELDPKKTQLVY